VLLGKTEDALWYNVELVDGTRAWLAADDGVAVEQASLAGVPVAATVPVARVTAPVGVMPEVTLAAEITSTPNQPTNAFAADRDGDGIADDTDDCPDEFGVADRGGCPFEGPSATDTPVPPPPPPDPTVTDEPHPPYP